MVTSATSPAMLMQRQRPISVLPVCLNAGGEVPLRLLPCSEVARYLLMFYDVICTDDNTEFQEGKTGMQGFPCKR